MGAHAPFGPSKLKQYELCPGSYLAEQGVPDVQTEYSAAGTLLHSYAAYCHELDIDAREGAYELPDYPDLQFITAEQAGWVQEYLNYIRNLGTERFVEIRVTPVKSLAELVWGTADNVTISMVDRVLHVADLKGGSGVKVEAANNIQTAAYGLGAYHEFEHIYGPFDKLVTHIVQPPLNNIDKHEYDVSELPQIEERIIRIVKNAQEPDPVFNATEEGCRFCKARATCKTRAEANIAAAQRIFGFNSLVPTLTLEEVGEILPQLADFKRWSEELASWAEKQALAGIKVPGHKLVAGRSVRKWRDEAEAIKGLQAAGLGLEEVTVSKVIGITEAERLLGKKKGIIDELASKAPGKPALVPETDKRPEFVPDGESLAAFAGAVEQ